MGYKKVDKAGDRGWGWRVGLLAEGMVMSMTVENCGGIMRI